MSELDIYKKILNKIQVHDVKENNKTVLDLIEENERLREENKHYEETTTFGDYVKEVNLLVDYKSRIDKAIEYLILFDDNSSLIDHSIIKGALNILRGEDK